MSSDALTQTAPLTTQAVLHHHLQAFLEGQGIDAVVADYDDNAVFCTEDVVYRGKAEIAAFFIGFLGALPEGAIALFALRSMQTDGEIGFITWSVGDAIELGTDTFVVRAGRIVAQTFVMTVPRPAGSPPPAG